MIAQLTLRRLGRGRPDHPALPRSAAEAFLGPKQLEARARNYYVLGMSLGMLFDISGAPEFLRALTRVLEEWEIMAEGGGSKVVSLVPYYS